MNNMFFSSCSADIPKDIHKYSQPEYAYVRCINLDDFKLKNIFNATFSEDGKYYISANVCNMSEKELIMQMYKDEKFFGKSEKDSQEVIIKKLAVEPKNNFFDYYA